MRVSSFSSSSVFGEDGQSRSTLPTYKDVHHLCKIWRPTPRLEHPACVMSESLSPCNNWPGMETSYKLMRSFHGSSQKRVEASRCCRTSQLPPPE